MGGIRSGRLIVCLWQMVLMKSSIGGLALIGAFFDTLCVRGDGWRRLA